MIRQKLSKFLTYTRLNTTIRRSLVSAMSMACSYSFIKDPLAATKSYNHLYDLAVIGGGSGGLATAFEANKHGLNVIVVDFVQQSLHKTKWGLGGTCVNVGCIPKKLMHQAAKYHEQLVNANDYGWELGVNERQNENNLATTFNWSKLRNKIQAYIKSINFGYVSNVNKVDSMDYLNCLATFKDKDTIICSKNTNLIKEFVKTGQLPQQDPNNPLYYEIKAKNFVIATGTRPTYLQIQGAQHAITSDDIFNKKQPPGKTLIVGGGYVAVEIAGFLKGMGYNVSLMTRGEYLRSFDRDMVNHIMSDMQQKKVNIVPTSLPVSIKKNEAGKLQVVVQNQVTKQLSKPEEFDTVLFAVGRTATTDTLNLQKAGLTTHKSKKIETLKDQIEKTQADNIYALGDVVQGLPELTSTATKMGWHLGRRIAEKVGLGKFQHHQKYISLQNYPTTIFTPLQYSCCGLSEEQAHSQFGKQNISIYHIKYNPLQQSILQKYNEDGSNYKTLVYAKAVVLKQNNKVIGLHYAGPNAGEVMQGYAVAVRMGITKQQLDASIGIHPTCAQELTNMDVTKQSGEPYEKTSC